MTQFFNEAVEFESEVRHKVLPVVFVDKLEPSSATPSVQNVTVFRAGGALVTVTNFVQGQEGQQIRILGDGLTTIAHNANIKNASLANLLLLTNTIYSYILIGNVWYQNGVGGSGSTAGEIVCNVDGSGSVITAGSVRYLEMPNLSGTITGGAIVGDVLGGTATIDVWLAASPTIPVVANSIVAAAPPTLLAGNQRAAVNVGTWTTVAFGPNSIIAFKVTANTLNTKITLALSITKS